MFCVNDTVMYGNTGVCKIADIRPEKFTDKEELYYILKPVDNENATIHCPTSSGAAKMRKLLSPEEIYNLIQTMPDTETAWIDNDFLRKEKFGAIIKEGNHQELIKLIKILYFNREEKKLSGKKFRVADEKMMKDAEMILYGEFAHVLKISREEVLPFIMGKIGGPTDAKYFN